MGVGGGGGGGGGLCITALAGVGVQIEISNGFPIMAYRNDNGENYIAMAGVL